MVSNTGRTPDTHRIRRLRRPRALEVEASADDVPQRLRLGNAWQKVNLARQPWRIDQHWWRAELVIRLYYRVVLKDGAMLTIYRDLVSGDWFRQEY